MRAITVSSAERGRVAGLWRALGNVSLVLAPTAVVAVLMSRVILGGELAFDFRWAYYGAAVHTLHGISLYQPTRWALRAGAAFVYPPLPAFLLAPLGLLSLRTSTHIYMYAGFLLGPLTLAVLQVRDWRVYAILMLWLPFEAAWQVGNVSLPLAFMTALVWRHRDRPLAAGLLVAAAISIKPFVWPLALWLLATRRWKASGWALACGLILNLLAWWVVGFDQIHAFLKLSSLDAGRFWRDGYSVTAVVHHLGGGHAIGEAVTAALAAGLGLTILRLGRRGAHRRALVAAVLLMLVASPIIWSHYFVLLVVPLAVSRPRLSRAWMVPLLLWLCPATTVLGWQAAVAWGATLLVVARLLLPERALTPGAMREMRRSVARGTGRPIAVTRAT